MKPRHATSLPASTAHHPAPSSSPPSPAHHQAKRQDPALASALQQYSALLTVPAFQSIAASIATDPALLSAVGAAQTSNIAPLQSYVSSLEKNPALSSAVYSALGTSSADAIYSSISQGEKSLQQAESSTKAGSGSSSAATGSQTSSSSSGGSNAAGVMQAPLAAGLGLIGATAFVLALI